MLPAAERAGARFESFEGFGGEAADVIGALVRGRNMLRRGDTSTERCIDRGWGGRREKVERGEDDFVAEFKQIRDVYMVAKALGSCSDRNRDHQQSTRAAGAKALYFTQRLTLNRQLPG